MNACTIEDQVSRVLNLYRNRQILLKGTRKFWEIISKRPRGNINKNTSNRIKSTRKTQVTPGKSKQIETPLRMQNARFNVGVFKFISSKLSSSSQSYSVGTQ
jgi:hypothetical protein